MVIVGYARLFGDLLEADVLAELHGGSAGWCLASVLS